MTNGNLNTSAYNGWYLKLTWEKIGHNAATNTTTVSWKVVGVGGSGYMQTRNVEVAFDGDPVYRQGDGTSSNYIKLYNGTVVASGNYTFTHDANGKKVFTATVKAGIYVWSVNCTGSESFDLDTIPRKSTLVAGDGMLGSEQILTAFRKSTSMTHTITYQCGSLSGEICAKTTNESIKWTPPNELATQAPNANSVSVTLTLTTYSGDTAIGTATDVISCSIPHSNTFVPVLMPTIVDAMGYSSIYGGFVQGQSKLKVDIETYGAYGANISSVKTVFDGRTYTETSFTTDAISGSGDLIVTITVTDSRGRTSTSTATLTVLAYKVPRITSLTAARCNEDGTLNPGGSCLLAKFKATITSLNGKNTAKYYVGYKLTTDADHTAVEQTNLAGQYSVNSSYIIQADPSRSYTVIFTAVDAFTQDRATTTGSSKKRLISMLKKNGEIVGMAINKVAEHEGFFDLGWPLKLSGGGDIVTEYGTKDGWTYRRWDSGVAECWKIVEFSTTINTQFGSLYCGNATQRQNYPFAFVEKPVETVTLQSGSTQAFLYAEASGYGVNGTNASARYNVFRPGAMATSQTFYLSFHILGKWK
jgi:hypothetical protein